MKLPIGPIARIALRFAVKQLAKKVADPRVPINERTAKAALTEALQDAAMREVTKRLGNAY